MGSKNGRTHFESDMNHCGTKCGSKSHFNSCFKKCYKGKQNVSDKCVGCFTDLAHCTKVHCWSHCIKGSRNSKCRKCVKRKCSTSFIRCSGLEPPEERLMRINHERVQM